ncbi:unnamed protein product [Allacma fusca]|uniref:Uncharacterized protein n=1 Tax=Allacma fusca TaxID=39272 RepID=A0A8J2PQD4_9HEXA|nr:unnamed protein product [Allacma fusca]
MSCFGARPALGVSTEEMQNLDVQMVLTEQLQDCLLNILQIKTYADYSKISNPYVLKDFVLRQQRRPQQKENIPMIKAQNLQCNVMIVLTGDILDTSPPFGYRPKLEAVSFRSNAISWFVKAQVLNSRVIPMLLLILHCDLPKHFISDQISKSVSDEYLNARTFVLFPGKVENNLQIFSGYYICWFRIICRVPFRCHGSDCVNTMMETFDLVTNFGKRYKWEHDISQLQFEIEVGLTLGSPFRRVKPWILFKTIYHFLIEDFYCNCSVLPVNTNTIRIGASRMVQWSKSNPIALFRTSGFHFITSDGVEASKIEMISLYTSPLEIVVWIAVTLSTIFTSIVLASGIVPYQRPSQGLELFLFSVFGNLMEQGSFIGSNPSKMFRTKSNSLETKESFCVELCEENDNEFLYGRSQFDDVTVSIGSSRSISHVQFRCVSGKNLSVDIKDILAYPKTALVVYSQHLEYYWKTCKEAMFSTKLKFAHNGRVKDDNFLRRWNYLFAPYSWSKKYDYIGNRAHVMMSSGLFMLWERWHKIRFVSGNIVPIDSVENQIVKALDLESSIVFVFYGFLWSALGCTLIFGMEIMQSICAHQK